MKEESRDSMQDFNRNSISMTKKGERPGMVVVAIFLAFLISGCALGPDYHAPEMNVAPGRSKTDTSLGTTQPAADPKWWKSAFQDPDLDQLVDEALSQNLTLMSAGLRVLQAQQLLAIAIGYQFPQQQQVSGSASRQKQSGKTFNNFNLGFNVGWEVDLWGRFSRQVESSTADLEASVAGYDGVVISLVGQVAQSYILIRTYQDQIEMVRDNIHLQKESLRIARANANAGAVSELDVYQGEVLVNATWASLAKLEIPLQQAKNSLAVLLGKPPQDMDSLLLEKRDIPSVRAQIALGMPQDLMAARSAHCRAPACRPVCPDRCFGD